MRVAYRGSGPLVVKLAGLAGGIGLYEEEMDAAAKAGFRVAALDTSGDRHDDGSPSPADWDGFAREVVAAIDAAGAERAVLWGTSYGCLVALAAAARYPGRVSGLLLCHPPGPRPVDALYRRVHGWAARRPDPTATMRRAFSFWFLASTAWEIAAPRLWIRLPSLWRASREAATPRETVRAKVELHFAGPPGLPLDGMPVEIIAGSGDLVAPLAVAEELVARLPGARLHVMTWSGHAGAYARPGTYRRLVLGALTRLAAPSR